MKIHIVQKGDTLWKIAKKYGVNFEELKKLNTQLSNPDMIMPGMKIKVPTAGGTIKKEGPVSNPGVKKEVPLKEQPVKEMPIQKEVPIKEVPVKEVPIKEQPVVEAPKAPYTPKMPLQIIPEIDVNNYYMMNMQQMKVEQPQLPPKPTNILPEVKKEEIKEKTITLPKTPVPPKEAPVQKQMPMMPIQAPPPMEAPVAMPQQDYCVPVTPILPGSGFCPPFGGFPVQPYMPFQPGPGMPGVPGMGEVPAGYVPPMAPPATGPAYIPQAFDDESSFIPPVPGYNPGGAVMGAQTGPYQQPMQMDPGYYDQMPMGSQMPMGYGQMPMGQGQMPMGYGQMPMGQGQMPMGYGQMPMGQGQMPMGYGRMPMGQGQMPMGYGQMPMGQGQMPMGYGQMPMDQGQMPTGYGQMPMDQGQMPMGYGQMPMGQGQMPMGYDEMPMGQGQMPMGYGEMPMDQGQMPMGSGEMPMGQGQMPMEYGQMPMSQGQIPMGSGEMPMGQGQMPEGYPATAGQQPAGGPMGNYPAGSPANMGVPYGYPATMGPRPEFQSAEMAYGGQMLYTDPPQGMPGSQAGGDCGCGGPVAPQPLQNFVPPTPPIYSAPYNVPLGAAQPPFMNPYGMGPVGQGLTEYHDESSS